jgi:hypothetical protein
MMNPLSYTLNIQVTPNEDLGELILIPIIVAGLTTIIINYLLLPLLTRFGFKERLAGNTVKISLKPHIIYPGDGIITPNNKPLYRGFISRVTNDTSESIYLESTYLEQDNKIVSLRGFSHDTNELRKNEGTILEESFGSRYVDIFFNMNFSKKIYYVVKDNKGKKYSKRLSKEIIEALKNVKH